MTKIIEVKGNSVVSYQVLENAGYKKIDNLTPDFPNRQFYHKDNQIYKVSFPVWKDNSVRLETINN